VIKLITFDIGFNVLSIFGDNLLLVPKEHPRLASFYSFFVFVVISLGQVLFK
jgi:hypothetical protein